MPINEKEEHALSYRDEALMKPIFELASFVSEGSVSNEMFILANLAAISTQKRKGRCPIDIALDSIYMDRECNLNMLCEMLFVSRRKLQYLLSAKNTSFITEVQRRRVDRMKLLLERETAPYKPIAFYAYKAGFKNVASASKYFLQFTNCSIRDFIKSKWDKYE